jgi:hypothetical protein
VLVGVAIIPALLLPRHKAEPVEDDEAAGEPVMVHV